MDERSDYEHLRATAYHEAGHAAVVVFLGYRVICASIAGEGNKRGHVEHTCPKGSEAFVMISLAGVTCLDLFDIPSDEFGGALQDMVDCINAVSALLPGAADDEQGKVLSRLRSETLNILQTPAIKAAVEALVSELLSCRTLDGSELHAVIEPVLAASP